MQPKANRMALKVALIYIIASSAWILFSDDLVGILISNPDVRIEVSIIKGWAFVLLTGGLLHAVLTHSFRRLEKAAELRRQQEELSRKNEEQFRTMFETASIGMAQANPQTGRWVRVNRRMCAITGYTAEEMLRMRIPDITHPEDRQPDWEAFQRVVQGEAPDYSMEKRYLRKNGTVAWVNVNVTLIRDEAGQPFRTFATIEDISERKRMEAVGQESERRYRDLFEHMNEGFALCRMIFENGRPLDFVYLAVNEKFAELTGLKEVTGKRVTEIIPGIRESDAELLEIYGRVAATGKPEKHECFIRALEMWFDLSVYSTGKDLFVVVFDVITKRKQMEAALREREEQLRLFVEHTPAAVVMLDNDMKYLVVSRRWQEDFRLGGQSLTGRSHYEVFPEMPPHWIEIHRRCLAGAVEKCDEEAFLRADGKTDWIRWEVQPWRRADGVIGGIIIFSEDITTRKQAEAALHDSEERYRQIFAVESDAILVVDRETLRFIDVNPAAERMYGYSREEFFELHATEVSAEPAKTIANIASDLASAHQTRHRRKDGTVFPVEVTDSTFEYQGRMIKVGAMRDITERKQTEEALKDSEEKFFKMFNSSPVPTSLSTVKDGRFLDVNDAWLKMYERSRDEVVGHTIYELNLWLDLDRRAALFTQLKEQGVVHNFELGLRAKSGRAIQTLWSGVLLDMSGETCLLGSALDVSERNRIEEQMNLQSTALTAAANAIMITDRKGRIEWTNPAFTKLTGFGLKEVIGRNPRLMKSDQHPPTFYATMWATISTGNVWHGELVNKRKDDRLYNEDMTITPVRGADGEIAHFVAIKQDITERRSLENQLRQAQKMEAIGTLAGGIAHDFNNILAAMFGYGYLLQQDTEGNAALQENIGEILKAASRAKDLVQQILTFSRQREQKRQVIHLGPVIKEAIKFLRASLPANIRIEMNLAADAPAILADPTQIYQVTMNLATNALHAMEGNSGQLTVNLNAFEPDKDFIRSHPEFKPGAYACLSIADTGHGMDAKTMERIFEPFFTTKPVGKGTGLGLAVVHGIIQSHEGSITVESEIGRGTTFRLYFPAQAGDVFLTNDNLSKVNSGNGEKILLVDDEPALTLMFQRLLRRLNYQVITTGNAGEAIRLFRKNPAHFDLVITDLTMPEMNGLELARQLRTIRPGMPVILASGLGSSLTEENLREAGIQELLEKPVTMTTLANAVQRTFAKSPPAV